MPSSTSSKGVVDVAVIGESVWLELECGLWAVSSPHCFQFQFQKPGLYKLKIDKSALLTALIITFQTLSRFDFERLTSEKVERGSTFAGPQLDIIIQQGWHFYDLPQDVIPFHSKILSHSIQTHKSVKPGRLSTTLTLSNLALTNFRFIVVIKLMCSLRSHHTIYMPLKSTIWLETICCISGRSEILVSCLHSEQFHSLISQYGCCQKSCYKL